MRPHSRHENVTVVSARRRREREAMAELGRKRQEPQVDPVTSVPSVNHTLAKGKQWQPKIILIQCWDLPHCKLKRRERLLFLLVVTMLSDAAKVPHACNLSTQYERNGLCCDRCRPGHHRVSWCDANAPTVCAPCPQGRFNPDFNTLHSCNFCKLCNTGFRQVEQEGCTPNHNSRCGCGNGTYEVRIPKDGSLFWCCPHCPAGHELAKQCHYRDFISSCAPCPPGSFSDGSGSPCRNHTRCEVVKQPPTNTSDAVCADPTATGDLLGEFNSTVSSGPQHGARGSLCLLAFGPILLCYQLHFHSALVLKATNPLNRVPVKFRFKAFVTAGIHLLGSFGKVT
ncbi:tumor necrosis factor receptor superfamily member 1B-like isoform X2 [Lampetra fluviatilis]